MQRTVTTGFTTWKDSEATATASRYKLCRLDGDQAKQYLEFHRVIVWTILIVSCFPANYCQKIVTQNAGCLVELDGR
jgi:hypothetical protein